jgi:3-dehydroquinate synthase
MDRILSRDENELIYIIRACIEIKSEIVRKDEHEQGIRAWLNLGHTFAHGLETFYKYEGLKHGQAVILGIKCALFCSFKLRMISKESVLRINRLIDRMDIRLPQDKEPDAAAIRKIMEKDKKRRAGRIQFVLPQDLGQLVIAPLSDENLILESLYSLKNN